MSIVAAARYFQSMEQPERFANASELLSRISGSCNVPVGMLLQFDWSLPGTAADSGSVLVINPA
jgi:hypothetical protein